MVKPLPPKLNYFISLSFLYSVDSDIYSLNLSTCLVLPQASVLDLDAAPVRLCVWLSICLFVWLFI